MKLKTNRSFSRINLKNIRLVIKPTYIVQNESLMSLSPLPLSTSSEIISSESIESFTSLVSNSSSTASKSSIIDFNGSHTKIKFNSYCDHSYQNENITIDYGEDGYHENDENENEKEKLDVNEKLQFPIIESINNQIQVSHVKSSHSLRTKSPCVIKQPSDKKIKKFSVSICVTYCRYPIVAKVAKSLGWKLVKDNGLWNILWTDSIQVIETFKDIKRFQRINHFPGMTEICRKDLLARNLNRMLKLFPKDFDIFPKTWCFPADLGEAMAYSKEHKTKTFILKPDQGAQGKGIWLTKNLKEVKPNERMICQVYVNRPLLIDGYKFDLRLYALVTSVDPLRIFVYNEGLVRLATSKYKEPSGQNTTNMFMHLTNYSINKHSRAFSKDNDGGSKRKVSVFNEILLSEGYDVETLWERIDDIIIKTLLSAWPILKHNYHACFPVHNVIQGCFEILGFDILIDSKLKPYILEVNHSPSFHTDEEIDRNVKEPLLNDTFKILNTSQIDKRKIINDDRRKVQNRLLKIKETPLLNNENGNNEDNNNNNTLDPMAQQIKWEESHLGNFRRIMPPIDDYSDKYKQFYVDYNQSSIYSETAASKRREEAAKQLRREILEREQKLQQYSMKQPQLPTDNADKKLNRPTSKNHKRMQKLLKNKRRYEKIIHQQNWMIGNFIISSDERRRIASLTQRDYLVRQSGIIEIIFETFYRCNLLSESDFTKYGETIEKIIKSHNNQLIQTNHEKNMKNVIDDNYNDINNFRNHKIEFVEFL